MVTARFARVCEELNLWCYHVCIVCVCVSKIFGTSKYKVLKDAGKMEFPCTARFVPLLARFTPLLYICLVFICIMGAKLMVLSEMSKK